PYEVFAEGREQEAGSPLVGLRKERERNGDELQRHVFGHEVGRATNNLVLRDNPPADVYAKVGMRMRQVTGTVHALEDRHFLVLVHLDTTRLDEPAFHLSENSMGNTHFGAKVIGKGVHNLRCLAGENDDGATYIAVIVVDGTACENLVSVLVDAYVIGRKLKPFVFDLGLAV